MREFVEHERFVVARERRLEIEIFSTVEHFGRNVGQPAREFFELRTYTATKGNLGGLDSRFKDHTIKLFEKHGMSNLIYWHLIGSDKDADKMLIYLLAHKSEADAKKSFDAFRMDPDWVSARKASEEKAGGSLTEAKGGVVSEFLKPTDYSPLK